ncbi:MAG: hypothetical protein HYX78_10530 [Armatimonadetes bacterium]|nr:hypothetical protein [Armatimonadota bacterium]
MELYKAFLARSNSERPIVGFWVGSNFPLRCYYGSKSLLNQEYIVAAGVTAEPFLDDYDRMVREGESIGDDIIRVAEPFWGIPWMEAILGCPIRSSSDSIWSEPCIDDLDAVLDPRDILSGNRWLQALVEFTDELVRHSNGRYPVGTPVLRGPADMLAAMLGVENFVLACCSEPESVRRLADSCTTVWLEVARTLLDRIPPFYGGHGISFYNLWAPGEGVWFQEDAAAFLSPSIYRDLILPCDVRISGGFGYTLFHLHSACLFHIEELLKIESLKVVEINRDPNGPAINEMTPVFRRIQEVKPLLTWGRFDEEEIEEMVDSLSPAGLYLHMIVDSVEQARYHLEKISDQCARRNVVMR